MEILRKLGNVKNCNFTSTVYELAFLQKIYIIIIHNGCGDECIPIFIILYYKSIL